ncbi:MAG: Fic family protein [Bacteroidetes bacterium]|nr:Fic family protein [Bacteroidota bacterium]
MDLNELFQKLDLLKSELNTLKPLKEQDEKRLWKKFLLDWNYNSNHMEGNTLTYSQTELLLIFDKVSGDFTGREIEEMKAHNVAIMMVVETASDKERELSEAFIRELNKLILVRPFWKNAITSDGQPTRREIAPGEYKKFPNSVQLENGEIFNYTSPEDTPSEMHELIKFYLTHSRSNETHKVWLAAMLHYKFVRIHPFDDGNGRVARLLMNYVLLKHDYPPCIIKDSEKKDYLFALNKADVGDIEYFVQYIIGQLNWSFEKSILAAKGESIDDDGDFDKEISLIKRGSQNNSLVQIKKSRKVLQLLFTETLIELLSLIEEKLGKLNELFIENEKLYKVDNAYETTTLKSPGRDLRYVEKQIFFDSNDVQNFGNIIGIIYSGGKPNTPIQEKEINKIFVTFIWRGYKFNNTKLFDLYEDLVFNLLDFKYTVKIDSEQTILTEKLYNQTITNVEMKEIAKKCGDIVLARLKNSIETSKKF